MGLQRLSILDTYGVRWSRETLARDVLQNFFDAATDFGAIRIEVDDAQRRVLVCGPAEFDLDLLAYVGATTKRDGTTAGGCGEGFKMCALVALRDFGASLRAGSGERALRARLDPVPLGRELCYEPESLPLGSRGSFVELAGCDDALLDAFRRARDRFRHAGNPRIGEIVAASADGAALFARSNLGTRGEIYYRRQERGGCTSHWVRPALTLVHDGPLDAIDGDRDRRDLRPEPIAEAITARLEPHGARDVIFALQPDWKYGSGILRAVVAAAAARGLRFDFPAGWLARESGDAGLGQLAERRGMTLAVGYLAEVGMRRPRDYFRGDLETRAPSPLEQARFLALRDLYTELAGAKPRIDALEVFSLEGAAVLGQHLGQKVIVGAELLHGDFAPAASTVLHELAHEKGDETSWGFLVQLGSLLSAAVRSPELVERARAAFEAAEPVEQAPVSGPIEAPAPLEAAYAPEFAHLREGRLGMVQKQILVDLVVPPAFVPSELVHEAVDRVAARLGVDVCVCGDTVVDDHEAHLHLARGVPTLRVGAFDCELGRVGAREPGRFAVRLYDHGGERLPWPTDAQIEAALRYGMEDRARTSRERGRLDRLAARRRYDHLDRGERRRLLRWLEWRRRVWTALDRERVGSGYDLASVFSDGWRLALQRALAATALDARTDEMRELARRQVKAWRAELAELKAEWPALDLDDPFDRAVASASMGAALATRAAAGHEAAREAYGCVRALADRALALSVRFALRDAFLAQVLRKALPRPSAREARFDAERALALFDAAERPFLRVVADAEERGVVLRHWAVRDVIDALEAKPAAPAVTNAEERRARSFAVRDAWHAAMAAGGTPARAAEAVLARVRELYPAPPHAGEVEWERARLRELEAGDRMAVWRGR